MAIFGTLDNLPLTELLPTLARRTGRLSVWGLPGGLEADIYLAKAQIIALNVNKNSMDLIEAHRFFRDLLHKQIGNFEFFVEPVDGLGRFELSIAQALAGGLISNEEVAPELNYLPAPQTRFVTTNTPNEMYLGFELDDFWTRAYPMLLAGANAEEIAHELGTPVLKVQSCLYRLRAAGRVQPLRAFQLHQATTPVAVASSVVAERDFITSSLPPAPAASLQPSPVRTSQPQAQVAQNSTNLLGRLLKALRFRN